MRKSSMLRRTARSPARECQGRERRSAIAAERDYNERKARGELEVEPFPEGVNCDVDRPPGTRAAEGIKPSDAADRCGALLPTAVKIGIDVKRKFTKRN